MLAPVAASAIEVLVPGVPVEDLELRRGERQLAVLVLPVERERPATEGAKIGRGRRPPLDERARAARDPDPSPENYLRAALRESRGDLAQLGVVEQPVRAG